MLHQKALKLDRNFNKRSPETGDIKLFTVSNECLHRFNNKLGLENVKLTEEAASADEEAPDTFPAEFKKVIRVHYYPWCQASAGGLETCTLWIKENDCILLNFMVTTKEKPEKFTHKNEINDSKHIATKSHQITKEDSKR